MVITGCQTYWTTEVAHAIKTNCLDQYNQQLIAQLGDLIQLVRGKPTPLQRSTLTSLIVIEVHARDIVEKMRREGVRYVSAFEWISQLRYYWEDDVIIRSINTEFNYGYEYLGNTPRLVITPLTDRYVCLILEFVDNYPNIQENYNSDRQKICPLFGYSTVFASMLQMGHSSIDQQFYSRTSNIRIYDYIICMFLYTSNRFAGYRSADCRALCARDERPSDAKCLIYLS